MKIKDNFEVKEVSGKFIVIPKASKNLDFKGIMTLNKSGKLLFEELQKGSNIKLLIKVLTDHFEVSEEVAENDVLLFLEKLKNHDLLK